MLKIKGGIGMTVKSINKENINDITGIDVALYVSAMLIIGHRGEKCDIITRANKAINNIQHYNGKLRASQYVEGENSDCQLIVAYFEVECLKDAWELSV